MPVGNRHRPSDLGTRVVGILLHFIMSVAMVVMAWPWGATLPTTGPLVFFLLAAVWFVAAGVTDAGHRVVNGYHALMMAAMSWMYAVMNGDLLPGRGGTAHGMPDTRACRAWTCRVWTWPVPTLRRRAAVTRRGWAQSTGSFTIGFAIAALWWVYRYFALRKAEPTEPWHRFLGAARQALMAAGMAIMFAVLL
jgi:hypothetical protein